MTPKIALIVAGGKGERMNSDIPKQFIELSGKPILMHTIETFVKYDPHVRIVIVLPVEQIDVWQQLCKKYAFHINHSIEIGGHTRFHSVQNGLKSIETPSIVAVHDGVRPLVSIPTIARCFTEAEIHKNAIPVVDLVDSLRSIAGDNNYSVNRSDYKLVQTPQVFDGEFLKKAYQQAYCDKFTDDASVVESLGEKIYLVEGNRENIKITTDMDLIIAKAILSSAK